MMTRRLPGFQGRRTAGLHIEVLTMHSVWSYRSTSRRTMALLAAGVLALSLGATAPLAESDPVGQAPPIRPIDAQHWQDQQDMTWNDYQPIPGVDWATNGAVPTQRALRVALVAQLYNNLSTAAFGQTVNVPVYVSRVPHGADTSTVTLAATSVSDPGKTTSATCTVHTADTTG
jgi:hypothetical protein